MDADTDGEALSSRTARVAGGTLTGVLQYLILIGLQVAIAPLVLRLDGQETLGAYSIIMQAISYIALIDLGFGVALNRYLARSIVGLRWESRFSSVFSIGRTYYLVTNFILAILVFLLSRNLGLLIHLSPATETSAQTGLAILAIWSIARTPLAVYGTALTATQNIAAANLSSIAGNLMRFAGSLGLVAAGWGVAGLIVANVLAECMTFAMHRWQFQRRFRSLDIDWGLHDRSLVREMLHFGGATFLLTLGSRLTYNADTIIVGRIFGASMVSVYYTTQMPAFVAFSLVFRLVASAEPAIHELSARGQKEILRSVYSRLHRYTIIAAVGIAFGYVIFGEALLSIWVGPEQFGGNTLVVPLAIFVVLITFSNIDYTYIIAGGRVHKLARWVVIEGLANVILSVLLGRWLGIEGVILATIIALSPRIVYQSVSVRRELDVPLMPFLQSCIFPSLAAAVVCSALCLPIRLAADSETRMLLGVAILIFGSSYIYLVYRWAISHAERRWIRATLSDTIKRISRSVRYR